MNLRESKLRFGLAVVLTVLLFGSFVFSLIKMQIGQGAYYKEQSEKKISTTETISAARGIVLDRNGEPLITNRNGYNITLSRSLLPTSEQNQTILELVRLLNQNGTVAADTLPLGKSSPFAPKQSDESDKKALAKLLKRLELDTSDGKEILEALCKLYKIDDGYTLDEKRIIAGIRYEMELREFSGSNPFTLAEDVSIETVTACSERNVEYPCVSVEISSYRQYVDSTVAPHLLGRIGKIYAEEYTDLKAKGYKMNDLVGKDGIEKAMEDYLRGSDGSRLIERNSHGEVLNVTTIREPKQGDNVVLTIDKKLQVTAQDALAKVIRSLQVNDHIEDASAGSVVVLQVDTGEILASASYPTYDLAKYSSDFATLSKDETHPLLNRAFNGTYAPGSTFKMATAISCLENNVITAHTKIKDMGIYTKYADYQPKCWVYDDYGNTHGDVSVSEALRDSCNYFFYDSADKLGIDALNKYCRQLGLGSKTGLELNESTGVLAGPQARAISGGDWYPGDTLQAAIGQSDNLFTPVQLATYLATVLNGGTRYKTHLVKQIKDSATGRNIVDNVPSVVDQLDLKPENVQAVMQGMYLTAAEGTAANVFANYPVHIGCKTGTATVSKGTANGIFVAFAPYEKPEIVVAVVVEHGAHGNSIAPIARSIFDAYFAESGYTPDQVGTNYVQP